MIHLRPSFGSLRNWGGLSPRGDFFLRLATPSLYRISDSNRDAQLERASSLVPYRISSDFPGNGGLVKPSAFFRIEAA